MAPARVGAQTPGAGAPSADGDADAGVLEPGTEPVTEPATTPALELQLPAAAVPFVEPPMDVAPDFRAVGVAPNPGAGVPLDKLPNNVQSLDTAALQAQHALSLSDALNAQLGSVTINDVQSNPLQPDVQYRGYTASPLLGTPQGISVYQNGVRLNEPFGDVLQWDLIPLFALAEVQVVPGENPVAGMNALGGSLLMRMKDGWSAPGARIEAMAGSFSRYHLTAEYGHTSNGWAGYAGASLFAEQGFRDHSPSSAKNLYADLRRRGSDYEVGVGLTVGGTNLYGNGPSPIELLRISRSAIYTWPDITQNDLVLVSANAQKRLARKVSLQGTLYFRHAARSTLNGDAAELSPCASSGGALVLCDEGGEPLRTTIDTSVPADQDFNAVYNSTRTVSHGLGGSLQLNFRQDVAGHANQLIVGTSYDGSQVTFGQRTELGHLTIDRSVEPDGQSLTGPGRETDLYVTSHLLGVYVVDSFNITRSLSVHASARFNWYETTLRDRLGSDLDGHHVFARVNPALGLTQRLGSSWTLFAGYGESNRAPSAAELACADPDEPCRLPNAFISDPPLKQVVSRSAEIGVRVRAGSPDTGAWLNGSLAAFGARNHDDILFVAGSHVGTGYFRNAGQTQRIGMELALRGAVGPVGWYAAYTLLRATFESELDLPRNHVEDDAAAEGGDDEAEEGGSQEVKRGSRIPGLPMHAVKAGVSVQIAPPLEISVSLVGQSSQPFRGDEANESPFLNGFVTLNAQASYRLFESLTLFVRAQNLLNTEYSTFGVLANPAEVLPGASDPRFQGPGAPFGIFAGVTFADRSL